MLPVLEPYAPVVPASAPEHHLVRASSTLAVPLHGIVSRCKLVMILPVPPSPGLEPLSLIPMSSAPPWLEEMDSLSDSEVRSFVS